MRLQIPQGTISVQETSETSRISPHSGRHLRAVQGTVHARSSEHATVYEALSGAEPLVSADDNEGNTQWRSRILQYSIIGSEYSYQIELTELEEVRAEKLILDGHLELTPYRYEEAEAIPNSGVIEIVCRIRTTPQLTESLFKLMLQGPSYFPVIREGVSSEPRSMRFGQCTWSRDEESGVDKHNLFLMEEGYDSRATPAASVSFTDSPVRGALAFEMEYFRGILDLLQEKGILSDAERTGAAQMAREKAYRRSRDF